MGKHKNNLKDLAWYWAAGALFYWWLIAKLQVEQLGAAVVVGFIVAGALLSVAAQANLSFAVEWRWCGLLLKRLPLRVLRDSALISAALARSLAGRRVTGAFGTRPFNPGGSDAYSATRRALVFAAVSLPPNTFAIRPEGRGSLLVHQLVFQTQPADKEWPL